MFYKQFFHKQFSFTHGSHCQAQKMQRKNFLWWQSPNILGYFSPIYWSNKISAYTSSESIFPMDSKRLTEKKKKKKMKICSSIPTSLVFSKQLQWNNHNHPWNWGTKMSLQNSNCALNCVQGHSLCPVIRIKDLAVWEGGWRGTAAFCSTCSPWLW